MGVTDNVGCTYQTVATLPAAVCGDNRVTGNEQCDPPGVGCCDQNCLFVSLAAQLMCRPLESQCGIRYNTIISF